MGDGYSSPFLMFDDEKNDFVFVIKTNSIIGILFRFSYHGNIHNNRRSEDFPNHFPDVRNKDGQFLLPNEYRSKLEHNSIVNVDVRFEL